MATIRQRKGQPPRVQRPTGSTASALTASAARARSSPRGRANNDGNAHASQWQLDALAYYDQIGAVRYAAQFWARALSKIRWYVGELDDEGEITESEDPAAKAILDRVQDPQGGRSVMLSTYGQLRFLTGECYLIWTNPANAEDGPSNPAMEEWEIVSLLELRKDGKRGGRDIYKRIMAPGLTPQELFEAEDDDFEPMPNEAIVYRLWRRHPAYSRMADAPMRSVLSDCEEIVRCTQTINARLISRLASAGIFAIPQSWTLRKAQPTPVPGQQENPEEDPIFVELQKAMTTAIGDPGSASAVVPIVVRVPDELAGSGKLYKMWDPNEVIREVELRREAVHRFAVGVDMPPAKVEGMETQTHWNAWAIDEEGWEHIDPVAQEFANDLGGVYLRPAAKNESVANWERLVVGYDATEILTNPDGFADAMNLYDRRVVGKAYLREAGNANDEDAPTDEELAEMLLVAVGLGQKQNVTVESGKVVIEDTTDEPATGEDTPRQAPPEPDREDAQDGLSAMAYRVLGAAETALEEVRGRIGSKLRSHLEGKCPECVAETRSTPFSRVASVLGADRVAGVSTLDLRALSEGAAANFAATVERWGVSRAQANALAEVIEVHAARSIFDPEPSLPAGFIGRIRKLDGPLAIGP